MHFKTKIRHSTLISMLFYFILIYYMENEKYLENGKLFRASLLDIFVGNDITISTLGELELLCNFVIEFNHYKI